MCKCISKLRLRSIKPKSFRVQPQHQILTEPLMPLTTVLRMQQVAEHQNKSVYDSGSMDTANLLNTTAVLQTEFSTRNYSDIMRSLAAKYNDSHTINSLSTRCNQFLDTSSSTSIPVTSKSNNQQAGNRNVAAATTMSVLTSKDTQPQPIQRLSMSPGEVAVAAAAASFLTSLPFSQSVCLPMMDMSSTQALITLARAAKEAEIQSLLRSSQPNSKPTSSISALPNANLNIALQQAAQYVSPVLISSIQLQQQPSSSLCRSSPTHKPRFASSNSSGSASKRKLTSSLNSGTVPLDLSSQPPIDKRFKEELNPEKSNNIAAFEVITYPSRTVENKLIVNDNNKPTRPDAQKCNDVHLSIPPTSPMQCISGALQCQAQSEEISQWSVDDVCNFVGEIDICAHYVQHFRDQSIDGTGLPLLTEDHLLNSLGMKLGPALKLRSMLAKKLGGPCPCAACITQARQLLILQSASKHNAVKPGLTASVEYLPSVGSNENSGEGTNVIETNDKSKGYLQDFQEVNHIQQASEPRGSNVNNESSEGSFKLQICANLYKNETNKSSHKEEEKKLDNFSNEGTTGDDHATALRSAINDKIKKNIKDVVNSNIAQGASLGS
ncbi:uncharacterized protein LOC101460610 isoform X2 [Ceratitis capitata]|uniref:Sterile alpha motif domain-containing protein 11 n=1 Tax=Ceratitis capitata TaxID=7213 RepID=W8AGH6_CERCA|nr:uncharacterized protein LOC101460610 isoform X2 [Ceratitis capitata]